MKKRHKTIALQPLSRYSSTPIAATTVHLHVPPVGRCFISSQGLEIRELKKSKPDKAALKPHIDTLMALKAEYKEKTGKDYVPVAAAPASSAKKATAAAAAAPAAEAESPAAAAISAKIVAKVRCGRHLLNEA